MEKLNRCIFSLKITNYLKKIDDIWNKFSKSMKKNLMVNPSTIKKFLKTKITSYGDKATDFHDDKMPKLSSNYICLVVILIDFVLKKMKSVILKCFWKNLNLLKRKKRWLDILLILLIIWNFFLMILINKILIMKIKKE